jgi:hypothetical protein
VAFLHFGVLVSSRIPYELLDPRPCLGEDGTLGQDRKVMYYFDRDEVGYILYSLLQISQIQHIIHHVYWLFPLSSSDQVTFR